MRLFCSELSQSYETYTFGYCLYCQREADDSLSDIYNNGFLPFSGSPSVENTYYMARSIRVVLPDYELTSENRRIRQKFQNLTHRRIPKNQFTADEPFLQFCLNYFKERHGPTTMPRDRLLYILSSELVTDIVEYKQDGRIVAYVFLTNSDHLCHYYYSFYDLVLTHLSLGLWLMLDALLIAKDEGKTYLYLGTAYREKGLYKTNFANLEYWNGGQWIRDRGTLRERCRTDNDRSLKTVDEWKHSLHLFS